MEAVDEQGIWDEARLRTDRTNREGDWSLWQAPPELLAAYDTAHPDRDCQSSDGGGKRRSTLLDPSRQPRRIPAASA